MALLRFALVGCIMLAVTTASLAREEKTKIDKAKLVGTWTFVKTDARKGPPISTMKVTFAKKGIVTVNVTHKDKSKVTLSGTYSIKGDQLTTVLTGRGGKEMKDTVTISELTDEKLVTTEVKDGTTATTEFKK